MQSAKFKEEKKIIGILINKKSLILEFRIWNFLYGD
jgi:hypothetical protein